MTPAPAEEQPFEPWKYRIEGSALRPFLVVRKVRHRTGKRAVDRGKYAGVSRPLSNKRETIYRRAE
jgi:hypothetical protein